MGRKRREGEGEEGRLVPLLSSYCFPLSPLMLINKAIIA